MRTKQSIGTTAIYSGEGPYMGIKWDMPTDGRARPWGHRKMAHAKVKCSASVEAEHQDPSLNITL